MGRKSHVRAKDEAVDMDQAASCASGLWPKVRLRYRREVRELVDAVAAQGGLSLHDIELLEFAEHELLAERIKKLAKNPRTSTATAHLTHLRTQCRKHLRALRLAMNPITTPNDLRHPEPEIEGVLRERKAAILADLKRLAYEPAKTDLGDELLD